MTHYFIKEGKKEQGPYTLEQLKCQPVDKSTQIWFAGLQDWTTLEHVYELKELFTEQDTPLLHPRGKLINFLRNLFKKKPQNIPGYHTPIKDKREKLN